MQFKVYILHSTFFQRTRINYNLQFISAETWTRKVEFLEVVFFVFMLTTGLISLVVIACCSLAVLLCYMFACEMRNCEEEKKMSELGNLIMLVGGSWVFLATCERNSSWSLHCSCTCIISSYLVWLLDTSVALFKHSY